MSIFPVEKTKIPVREPSTALMHLYFFPELVDIFIWLFNHKDYASNANKILNVINKNDKKLVYMFFAMSNMQRLISTI